MVHVIKRSCLIFLLLSGHSMLAMPILGDNNENIVPMLDDDAFINTFFTETSIPPLRRTETFSDDEEFDEESTYVPVQNFTVISGTITYPNSKKLEPTLNPTTIGDLAIQAAHQYACTSPAIHSTAYWTYRLILEAATGGIKEVDELLQDDDINPTAQFGLPLHEPAAGCLKKDSPKQNTIPHLPLIGMTALMAAAQSGHHTIIERLLQSVPVRNAINCRDLDKKTALGHALNNNHNDIADLIRKKGGHI